MNSPFEIHSLNPPRNWDRSGLPVWTYLNEEMFELEAEELFRRHWQLACNVSDVPEPGCYISFDLVGERALIMRDSDNHVRAFHNVCRHRGSRVVEESEGRCSGVIVCPFHGWSYSLDGKLRGPAKARTFPKLDSQEWGLKPLEMEIWHGFVFVRFKPGPQPAVAKVLERFDEEMESYYPADLLPVEPISCTTPEAINWKSIRDVDNEGYHVSRAHLTLNDLYGNGYLDEPFVKGICRSYAPFNEGPGSLWSVRHYKSLLDKLESPYNELQRAWVYLGMFPNLVIGLYPDCVMFYQDIPFSAQSAAVRGSIYKRPQESRSLRLARYLSTRIDASAVEEDRQLTLWSFEAMKSSGYDGILLSDLEYGVRSFHDALRGLLPVMRQEVEPPQGMVSKYNTSDKTRIPEAV